MEYKNTHQTRLSDNYLLVIGQDATGVWRFQIRGPRAVSGSLESIHLSDVQSEAYSVAARYFTEKGIVDLRIPREKIAWVAHP